MERRPSGNRRQADIQSEAGLSKYGKSLEKKAPKPAFETPAPGIMETLEQCRGNRAMFMATL